ncbi:uncharacterized protein LOC125058293 isoform X3 [Pieris napi]|uniref:uncharacterized protein LOC125058293 isoform X3 n=1 Tax=Pieris napi TaxID=78633 RepID=UPI001FB90814|nr:uncharacterized protein LOC125058293 isoform X3 [Pieris napi]
MEDLKDGMCRCCASEGTYKDFTASYQWMGAEEVYSDMLKDCFDITLSTSLENNGGICEVCITQLRNAFNFKKQVQNTEEQFKRMQDKFLKEDIVKIELSNDPMENSDGGDNIDDDFSSPEYDVPIQSIKIEKMESKTKKRPARASTSKAKKPKVEVGEPSNKRDVSKTSLKENSRSNIFEPIVNLKIGQEHTLSDIEDCEPKYLIYDEYQGKKVDESK